MNTIFRSRMFPSSNQFYRQPITARIIIGRKGSTKNMDDIIEFNQSPPSCALTAVFEGWAASDIRVKEEVTTLTALQEEADDLSCLTQTLTRRHPLSGVQAIKGQLGQELQND